MRLRLRGQLQIADGSQQGRRRFICDYSHARSQGNTPADLEVA